VLFEYILQYGTVVFTDWLSRQEYSFVQVVFLVFFGEFFLALFFLKIRLKNLTGHDVLNFSIFLHLFE